MNDLQRTINILGAGTLAHRVVPKVLAACDELDAIQSINAVGVAEFNRASLAHPVQLSYPGVVQVSPDHGRVRHGTGFAGWNRFVESTRLDWERPAYEMVDKVVRAIEQRRLTGGQTLWIQGMRTGHGPVAEEMLLRLKERVPHQFIIGKSVLPADADQRPKAVIGYDLFHTLHSQGVLELVILADNASPFVRKFTLRVQDAFEARGIAGLLAGQRHFGKTRGLAEFGRSLGEHGVFAGWSFCSRSLEPAREGLLHRARQAFSRSASTYDEVHLQHTVHEVKLATATALTDPEARAIDEDIDFAKPLFLIYTIPLALDGTGAWEALESEIRRWLEVTYPNAVPIFTSGHGSPDPRFTGKHWLQVSCLFPLPPVPRPIRDYVPPQVSSLPVALPSAAPEGAGIWAMHANGTARNWSTGTEGLR